MKRFFGLLCVLTLMCLSVASAELRLVTVSCGKADALLLTVDGETCLIDTATARSRGRILAAMRAYDIDSLDAVVITHTDKDHTGGLSWLADTEIPVGTWYASAMFTGVKKKKHPAVQAANRRGQDVCFLAAGDSFTLGGAEITVLAPSALAEDEDNNSLVLRVTSEDGTILLCGDMEYAEEALLLQSGANLSCDVLKVANHGDDDTGSEMFLRAAAPKVAVIPTSTREKAETPDAMLMERLAAVGAETNVTQECTGWITVTLTGGMPEVLWTELPEAAEIFSVSVSDGAVTVLNCSGETQSLQGWYLYSAEAKAVFVFDADDVPGAGETLTVGANGCDRTWAAKKLLGKDDTITLYDPNGQPVG